MFAQAVRPFEGFSTEIAGEGTNVVTTTQLFVVVLLIVVVVVVVPGGTWFMPPSVRGQIGGTIEDFVTFRASVFHMNNHGASAEKMHCFEEKKYGFLLCYLKKNPQPILNSISANLFVPILCECLVMT
jgi:hypothetical protein